MVDVEGLGTDLPGTGFRVAVRRVLAAVVLAAIALTAGSTAAAAAPQPAGIVPAGGADLAIAVSASTALPYVDHSFDWTIQVSNDGPDSAASVTVTDVVPEAFALISVVSNDFACSAVGNAVACTKSELAAGATGSIVVGVMVPDSLVPETVTNVATVGAASIDPDPADNTASSSVVTVIVQVGGPDAPPTLPPDAGVPDTAAPPTTTAAVSAKPDFADPLPATGVQPPWLLATAILLFGLGLLALTRGRHRRA